MKPIWIISIPLAFVSGIVTIVVLQQSGWISVSGDEGSAGLPAMESATPTAQMTNSRDSADESELAKLEERLA